MPTLEYIAKIGWLQRWAGSYTLISCSYWGPQYHTALQRILGVSFNHTLFIHRKGTVSFYIANEEFRSLGKYLADKSVQDYSYAREMCLELQKNTDILEPLLNNLQSTIPSWEQYQEFYPVFERHLAYHVFVKKTIDFLPSEHLEKLLPDFTAARLYSEKIYSQSEEFFRNIMKAIALKENRESNLLTCLTQEEFETYLQNGSLPGDEILAPRFEACALYFENDTVILLLGDEVGQLESLLVAENGKDASELQGICAYGGKVQGIARIVPDPHMITEFNEGDILVTGMTRPEFMPLIEKASAIVTEAGGILSHAAITAREFKKPCIVGTQIATKVFKDGDMLEVDAITGIVRKI